MIRLASKLSEPSSHMIVMGTVFLAIGLTLVLQPHRYDNTPSYANLLNVANQNVWGALYLLASVMKFVSVLKSHWRGFIIVAHTVSITLLSIWLVAFIVRYATDTGTTIVNVCSWSVFLYLVVRNAGMTGRGRR